MLLMRRRRLAALHDLLHQVLHVFNQAGSLLKQSFFLLGCHWANSCVIGKA